jgi:hypothetical protein
MTVVNVYENVSVNDGDGVDDDDNNFPISELLS